MVTLAVPCLVQPLLPLGRPALRRLLRNQCLGVLARPRRPVHLRPITPNPLDLCLAAVSEPSLQLRLPVLVVYLARPQHPLLLQHQHNPPPGRLQVASSRPSLPKCRLLEDCSAALRLPPLRPGPALLPRPHRQLRRSRSLERPLPPPHLRQQPPHPLQPSPCSQPLQQPQHRRLRQLRPHLASSALLLPPRRLRPRHRRLVACLARNRRPPLQHPARPPPRLPTPCLASRRLPLRPQLPLQLLLPLPPQACWVVSRPPRPQRKTARPAPPPVSQPPPRAPPPSFLV